MEWSALILLSVVVAFALSLPENAFDDNQLWPIPQAKGGVRWMTEQQAMIEAHLAETRISTRKMDKVRFFLYTQSNPIEPIELAINNNETLARSAFNKTHPTRFMIHGWNGGLVSQQNEKILDAVFNSTDKSPSNLVIVDWSVYGEANYILAQSRCSKAGKIIAKFIDWLHDYGKLSLGNLTLIGHSLGAHVAGFAGKNVKRGRVHTIIGSDPAMPLFNYNNPKARLSSTDAEYVETITTSGGKAGFYKPIGKVAFYPNGGKHQPGCGLDAGCAHERAVDYIAEAIKLGDRNAFYSVGCKKFKHVKTGKCNVQTASGIRLGDPSNEQRAEGIYYLTTNTASPFGKGNVYGL